MRGKKLLVLIGSICLILMLAALPFVGACAPEEATPTPTLAEGLDWSDVPIYEGAEETEQGDWTMPPPPRRAQWSEEEVRFYASEDSAGDVADFYRTAMPDNGWQEMGWRPGLFDMEVMAFYTKDGGNQGATVIIGIHEGKTFICLKRQAKEAEVEMKAGVTKKEEGTCDGYTIYSVPPPDALPGQRTTLIDMKGEIVHEWSIVGQPAMLPGGSVLGNKCRQEGQEAPLKGGAIEFMQEGWDGQVEWFFSNWEDDGTGVMMSRQHHDYQREGNPAGYYAPGQEFVDQGKTLILAHKNKVVPEISDKELADDVIYEVDWNGNLTGFEWHAADHFDEYGFDQSAREQIYKNPQYNEDRGCGDWLHLNTLSVLGENHWYDETGDERFNPENIIISSRTANFIAIISRATGNIVWRVGPDFLEGTPEYALGQFVGQHHPHMIPRGLPGQGNILIFDNGGDSGYGGATGYPRYKRDYSRIIEFDPVTLEIVWQYGAESGKEKFFSHYISSAQRLPNGNTLITEGANGRVFEVTPDKENVWEFISQSIGKKGNAVYRAYRIPPEWVPGNPAGYDEWAKLYE